MALIQSYEVPGTGLTAANAYFVVTDVKVQKRMEDIPTPVDTSDPDKLPAAKNTFGRECTASTP